MRRRAKRKTKKTHRPYRKVRHVMVPRGDVPPAQVAWIERVADQVDAFVRDTSDLAGPEVAADPGIGAYASFVVQTAAELVWQRSEGKPSWRSFDTAEYIALMAAGDPLWDEHAETLCVGTLMSFVGWMGSKGKLPRRVANRLMRELREHANDTLRAMLASPPATAAASPVWN